MYNYEDMVRGARLLLTGLGVDFADKNFVGTPDRIARSLIEMCRGLWAEQEIEQLFDKVFPSTYDQMIVERNIDTIGLCPHHFLPVKMIIHIGYIPNGDGTVIGISKLARLARLLSARPVLQEQLPEDIANEMERHLQPLGVGVLVVGQHGCMQCRGVYTPGVDVVTSVMRGSFLSEPTARNEFMSIIKLA